jgi:predicted extracellular nuclease
MKRLTKAMLTLLWIPAYQVHSAEPVLIGDCGEPATFISVVQGDGLKSALIDEDVVIEGVVTKSSASISGFFVQEETFHMDDNVKTSEGIFILYNDALPNEGEVVRLTGTVSEAFDRTQIAASQVLTGCGTASVATTDFMLPLSSVDSLEALEGMLVSATTGLVVTNTFALSRFGQVTLSSSRLFTPTNIYAPGSNEAVALAASNELDRIILDDGNNAENPTAVIYPTGGLSAKKTLRLGDTVSSLTGVIDYSFGEYQVIPTISPTFTATNPRTNKPDSQNGNLTVASLNVLNYFVTLDDGTRKCGPQGNASCRGADNARELARQKAKTVATIIALNADIVGLLEIENNGFTADSAIGDLVSAINAELGGDTYAIVNPGGPVGTDTISNALIYKPTKVSLDGELAVLSSDNSPSDSTGVLFDDGRNRPSLIQSFTLAKNSQSIVISINHFKSKGSRCGEGDDDTTTGQGSCNLTRTRAAQGLTAFINDTFPDKPAIIIGDLNAYAKEDPITAIEKAGYTNLISKFVGEGAYSYSFRGLLGYLDHALANEEAVNKITGTTVWHINADEPIALDYNTEFKSQAQIVDLYANNVFRASDHDPILITLQLGSTEAQTPPTNKPLTSSAQEESASSGGSVGFVTLLGLFVLMGIRRKTKHITQKAPKIRGFSDYLAEREGFPARFSQATLLVPCRVYVGIVTEFCDRVNS